MDRKVRNPFTLKNTALYGVNRDKAIEFILIFVEYKLKVALVSMVVYKNEATQHNISKHLKGNHR